jgi:hypothetical protein
MRRRLASRSGIIVRRAIGSWPATVRVLSVRRMRDVHSGMHRQAKQGGDQDQNQDEAAVHI